MTVPDLSNGSDNDSVVSDTNPHPDAAGVNRTPIGSSGEYVHAMSFSGSGFDSVMQMGVIHALLVIRGRAPDIVVGISAGAIQAVALAEVLQQGNPKPLLSQKVSGSEASGEKSTFARKYSEILATRVRRFREILEAYYRAPQELYLSALPDAYQIDTHDPLLPLMAPRFSREERESRTADVKRRAGLVRLYNHLLRIHLPIGTLVRLLRRYLGYKAAGELPPLRRYVERISEALRGWILLGNDLLRVTSLSGIVIAALFPVGIRSYPRTAGSLIFRFSFTERLVDATRELFFFVILAAIWLGITLVPFTQVLHLLASSSNPAIPIALVLVTLVALTVIKSPIRAFTAASIQLLWIAVRWFLIYLGVLLVVGIFIHWIGKGQLPENLAAWSSKFSHGVVDFLLTIGWLALSVILLWKLLFQPIWRKVSSPSSGLRASSSTFLRRLLKSYDLDSSLFHTHDLECFLANLFDKKFYGHLSSNTIIEQSLREGMSPSSGGGPSKIRKQRKKLNSYLKESSHNRVALGLAVANIGTARLEVYPPGGSVVEGLLAAMAKVPLLPPQLYDRKTLYCDGAALTNGPTKALLQVLRKHVKVADDYLGVHLFRVSPLPLVREQRSEPESEATLCGDSPDADIATVLDVVKAALRTERFRDAELEKNITDYFYTRMIPDLKGGQPVGKIELTDGAGNPPTEVHRLFTTPIELDSESYFHRKILLAPNEEARRKELRQIIADGCRKTMETLIVASISKEAAATKEKPVTVSCRKAVTRYLADNDVGLCFEDFGDLPGAATSDTGEKTAQENLAGPGLPEICQHCCLSRNADPTPLNQQRLFVQPTSDAEASCINGVPDQNASNDGLADWPLEFSDKSARPPPISDFSAESSSDSFFEDLQQKWPRGRPKDGPLDRPTVNLLFSGGVFRGVFQMGVINALREIGLSPDIVAGSSIGAITAATSTRALKPRSPHNESELEPNSKEGVEEKLHAARLAASYLAVDSLLLTDCFADFIRELTVRAADSAFSLRQADRLFRQYDYPAAARFGKDGRRVVAGLERLLFVNPYQVNELVSFLRYRKYQQAADLLLKFLQDWLDRSKVSEEILGAEPLELLIRNFVLKDDEDITGKELQCFYDRGIHFICTTTPMDGKQLLRLGLPLPEQFNKFTPNLVESLLASSAFPGVFRPRRATDLFVSGVKRQRLFIDGGILDNFPIGSVPRLLNEAAEKGLVKGRPSNGTPHLVVAASLEPELHRIEHPRDLEFLESYWPATWARIKQLKYNKKLDLFEKAINNRERLYAHYSTKMSGSNFYPKYNNIDPPLNLRLVTIKPRWLCGTFSFHPMLGYSRKRQAQSIAHGCATTLIAFRREDRSNCQSWEIDHDRLPNTQSFEEAFAQKKQWSSFHSESSCWLRPGRECPFSKVALRKLNDSVSSQDRRLRQQTIEELARIHRCCSHPTTHLAS